MYKKYLLFISISLLIVPSIIAQNEDVLFERLRATKNRDVTFYNVDGYSITSQNIDLTFDEKNLKKIYKKYKVKKNSSKTQNKDILQNHYLVKSQDKVTENLTINNNQYFIENKDKQITVIAFGVHNKENPEFEKQLITLILNNKVPNKCFSQLSPNTIDFAGRKIELGGDCRWMNVNNVQCPYYGQMDWSIHQTLEDAQQTIENRLVFLKNRKGGKVVSEEWEDVIFEGSETKAKKIIFDFKGIKSALLSLSGGKTLTIYMVATTVRAKYNVSCMMSFWNNDAINPKSELPALLEEVMKLEKNN